MLGYVPHSSPPADAKTLRDGGPYPRRSLLSLANGRLLPSRKPEVFKEGNGLTVNPDDAESGHGM